MNPSSPSSSQPVSSATSFAMDPIGDEHLRVDEVHRDLRRASTRGGALMIVSHAVQLLIGVAGTAILARLLRPHDFGYLAMVATLTSFVATFKDLGLPMAAVQKEELAHAQASGLFWVNALAGVGIAAFVAAMAPGLAWFYGEPRLIAITLVMAIGVLIHSMSMVHVGILRRRMNFTAVTMLEVAAMVVGLIVGVGSALAGASYWALVFQQVSIYAAQTAGAWLLCGWRPALPRASATLRDPHLRSMLHYGKDVSAARIVGYIGRNTDSVLVGYFAGPAVLGLYQKAYQWSMVPFWQIYNPLLPVAVSSFSRLQSDPERYRGYVRTTMLGVFSITLPATMLLLLEATPVILLLLGQQWVEAIPLFRILAVGAYFAAFTFVMKWLYLAEGRTAEQLRWALFSTAVTVIGVAIGLKWGASGVAMGFSAATALLAPPGIWYALRRSPLRGRDVLASSWRPIVASLVAAGGLLALHAMVPNWPGQLHVLARLLVESLIYAALYIGLWIGLPGGRAEVREVLANLRLLLPRSN